MISRADSGRGKVLWSPANLVVVEVKSPQRNEALVGIKMQVINQALSPVSNIGIGETK